MTFNRAKFLEKVRHTFAHRQEFTGGDFVALYRAEEWTDNLGFRHGGTMTRNQLDLLLLAVCLLCAAVGVWNEITPAWVTP